MTMAPTGKVMVIGATGYVGGRLVARLLAQGRPVVAVARSLDKLAARHWAGHPLVQLRRADVLDPDSLVAAARGAQAAVYLVPPGPITGRHGRRADLEAARHLVRVAPVAGLERLLYLGPLPPDLHPLPPQLNARQQVGHILQSGPVPCTWLRAGMILGSGSAAFETLRYMADSLPLIPAPAWMRSRMWPISVRNVVAYVAGCLERDETSGQRYDLRGPEETSLVELMQAYAVRAGLGRRRFVPWPTLTPRWQARWLHLVTPVNRRSIQPLVEALWADAPGRQPDLAELIPQDLLPPGRALDRILEKDRLRLTETCWSDAGPLTPPEWVHPGDASYAGGPERVVGYRLGLAATPEEVWEPISRLGGDEGWYFGDRLWRLRGWADKLVGGPGLRRGRRHPTEILVGDALDFWRVLEVEPPRRLRLLAEMRVPGEALLDFLVVPTADGGVELRQVARFRPRGPWGRLYWWSVYPLHDLVFLGMLKALAQALGKPITSPPARFDPRDSASCRLP